MTELAAPPGSTSRGVDDDPSTPAGHGSAPDGASPRWLREVRLRAARRVLFMRHRWSQRGYADEQLLAISHSEVDRALEPSSRVRRQERDFQAADPQAAALTGALEELLAEPEDPPMQRLVDALAIDRSERALLALAIAAAVDPPLTRVLGYVSDSVEASGATPALAADLYDADWPPVAPDPQGGALRWRLLSPAATRPGCGAATVYEPDPAIVRALFSPRADTAGDWSAGCLGRRPDPRHRYGSVNEGLVAELAAFARDVAGEPAGSASPSVELELVGPAGSGRRTLATRVAAALGREVVVVDAAALLATSDPQRALIVEARRAVLERAAIAIVCPDAGVPDGLVDGDGADALAACPLVLTCTEAPAARPAVKHAVRRSATLAPLRRDGRLALWSLLGTGPAPAPVTEWALRPGEIAAAARAAPGGPQAVADVCRSLLSAGTSELYTPLPLPFTWDDLVLAPEREVHLRELEAQARDRSAVLDEWGFHRLTPMGRGTTALFAGPSGTGKTMAAQVLAGALGLDCIRVDLAGVVNKYIGETEKRLRQLFDACERSPALLLFDEADALFGKRTQVTDAHDRFANIEIDYLLQLMERFEGLAVLATNRKADIDPAFVRRLRFIVHFSAPSAAERERLWRRYLEGARDRDRRPLVGELDYPALAAELDLTAADIKSAALAAAHLAFVDGGVIEARHVWAAGRRELEKQGQVVRAAGPERG